MGFGEISIFGWAESVGSHHHTQCEREKTQEVSGKCTRESIDFTKWFSSTRCLEQWYTRGSQVWTKSGRAQWVSFWQFNHLAWNRISSACQQMPFSLSWTAILVLSINWTLGYGRAISKRGWKSLHSPCVLRECIIARNSLIIALIPMVVLRNTSRCCV